MAGVNYNSSVSNYSLSRGFTLAEILITIGIIGIVAALTIPTISKNIQNAILKNQFKKFYSTFSQAIFGVQTKNGRPIKCHYWEKSPYTGKCTPVCSEKNDYGTCIGNYTCQETQKPIPLDYNGPMSECTQFHRELFLDTLKTTKICQNNAYEQGCLPPDFRGPDEVLSEQNPDNLYDPNGDFKSNSIKNRYPVFVLADGSYIVGYYQYFPRMPIYVIDTNGSGGPNKWGYDIFSFRLYGDAQNGIHKILPVTHATEKGGKTSEQMYDECFK